MSQATRATIDNDEVTEIARRFNIYPAIHQEDFIFDYHKNNPVRDLNEAVELYYHIGSDSAKRLMTIIDKCMPLQSNKKLSVFEFAAGYGCVTRHLKIQDGFEIIPCDIHDKAVSFMSDNLGLQAILSSTQPQDLNVKRRFDVVFALSFFTHMPASTWTTWFGKLFSLVDDSGVFIFTTHGFKPWRNIGLPHIEEDGFWFAPASEQKDLSTADYGCTISLPHYVLGHIRTLVDGELVFYEQEYWGGLQDTFVVRRRPYDPAVLPSMDVQPQHEIDSLKNQLRALRPSAVLADLLTQKEHEVDSLTNQLSVLSSSMMPDSLIEQKQHQINTLKNRLHILKSSNSWRITRPLRALGIG